MKKPVRRVWKVLLGVVVFLAIALTAVPVPERTGFGPSISELRELATPAGQPLPTEPAPRRACLAPVLSCEHMTGQVDRPT